MIEQPLVSIAIPAFNPEFFSRALLSAISQSYTNLEVIVCDDSQGDEIKAIFDERVAQASCELRYSRNPATLGFAGNLLQCLEHSRGEFIKFLCDDDWLIENCIEQQARIMADCPEVNMVVNHRLICAADETLLPPRPANCVIAPCSAILNGGDMLDAVTSKVPNLFGGISHMLMRRAAVEQYLPQLVQQGAGFVARLDMALYMCLLRRGHLAYLSNMLSIERVHAGRLSHQAGITLAHKTESEWLQQMLAANTGEAPPATGWIRYVALEDFRPGETLEWDEYELTRLYAGQMGHYQQQVGTHSLSFAELYAEWLECRTLSPAQISLLPKRIEQWPRQPRIVAVVFDPQGEAMPLKSTLDSLAAQSYAPHQVWVLGTQEPPASDAGVEYSALRGNGFEQLNARIARAESADWVLLLRAGDRLHPHALVIMAERLALHTDRLCLYTDEGSDDNLQVGQPIFKPDFNLDLMRSFPYVGRMLAFERTRLLELGGFTADYDVLAPQDLLWRMVESHGLQVVEHVAELLVQSQYSYSSWQSEPACLAQAPRVLQAHLQRLGIEAELVSAENSMLTRVLYQHADTPAVSIIIVAGQDLQALRRCVESIFEHTAYRNYEVLIATKGDEPQDLQSWLAAMRQLGSDQLHIVQSEDSAGQQLINQAAEQARGSYLLLVDPGCLMFDGQWLSELMRQGQRPEVGIVGPKMCSSAGMVVNAGLLLGVHGLAGSPFYGQPVDAGGYMNRLLAVQNLSAVSAHCLLVRRDLFDALGGLDVQAFSVELLDADFCLRAREQGYLVVWTPFSMVARLPVEQVVDTKAIERDQRAFYQRWLPLVANDPAYNRNLSLKLSSYNLEPGLRSGWDPFISRPLPYVLALPVNTTAVGHYRVVQPFTELERAGWIQGQLDYATPNTIEMERCKPDSIILQCRYMASTIRDIERVKTFSSARRIYEIDDYIIDVPKKNAHSRNMPQNMHELVSRGISLCDRVVVSTQPLADALSSMHHDIRVVPNMLAMHMWSDLKSHRQTTLKPRVGWAGGTSHQGDLELLAEVVRELADEVDWVFFGMCPEVLRPYVKEYHTGIAMSLYPQKLASLNLDLALAPLETNLFNDCKSNLRLLEYGACGFPVVCSDTKAYQGYLPCTRVAGNSTQAWLEAIRMHLDDPQASYRQGDALREVVLRDFMLTPDKLQHWANAWLAD
ncbi:glycosyltransferase [Pseudomonas sp. B21-032]|uniref:glycosyltransferase n=1 Tax=Pseudomonas sp. B21-032 TaxID=2895483 RepID=UPI00215F7B55|nr:glycosyltransferase [Pseudomonas sp. B21-032]UVL63149.1 glycosyltransferase [Pseudomonas sp. B21-032]